MRHENPLEIFPYGDPPPPHTPHWKIRQIDPLPPGKWEYGYFSGTTQLQYVHYGNTKTVHQKLRY